MNSFLIAGLLLLACVTSLRVKSSHANPLWKLQTPPAHVLQTSHGTIFKRDGYSSVGGWVNDAFNMPLVQESVWLVEFGVNQTATDYNNFLIEINATSYVSPRYYYDSPMFRGVSLVINASSAVAMPTSEIIGRVADTPSVTRVWPTLKHKALKAESVEIIGPFLNAIPVPGSNATVEFPPFATETGVKYAHEKGLTGAGIRIGIVDSGVDYEHPFLGGCFGKGCKVRYGYSFIEGESPDDISESDIDHGTFVAGIAAGYDKVSGWSGVAPGATLGIYKIFSSKEEGSSDELILAALERAYKDGMDIVNLSLGNGPGWQNSPTSMAPSVLASLGIVVVAAAGNGGSNGLYDVNAPSVAPLVTSTASIDSSYTFVKAFYANKNSYRLIYYSPSETKDGKVEFNKKLTDGELVLTSSYTINNLPESDACDALQDNVKGKIVLIRRGTCTFGTKANNAEIAGAKAVLIYDNEESSENFKVGLGNFSISIPVYSIKKEDAFYLIGLINESENQTISTTWPSSHFVKSVETAGKVSSFSSLGLSSGLELKPDIAAPGGQIASTVPMKQGGFGMQSGTSMASPYVAGCYALMMESIGTKVLNRLKKSGTASVLLQTVMLNNAQQLSGNATSGNEYLDSPARQGSGLINIKNALLSSQFVLPSKIQLKYFDDSDASKKRFATLTVINTGRDDIEYEVSHQFSIAINGKNVSDPLYKSPPKDAYEVNFSQDKLFIPSGQSSNVTVYFSYRENSENIIPDLENWLLGGFILFTPSNSAQTSVSVPYAFYKGSFTNVEVLNTETLPNSNSSFPVLVNTASFTGDNITDMELITENANFNFNEDEQAAVAFRLRYGTPKALLVILDDKDDPIGVADSIPYLGRNGDTGGSPPAYILGWAGNYTIPTNFEQIKRAIYYSRNAAPNSEKELFKNINDLVTGLPLTWNKNFTTGSALKEGNPFSELDKYLTQEAPDQFVDMVEPGTYSLLLVVQKPGGSFMDIETWQTKRFGVLQNTN
ncbi:hypothetical protein MP638_005959 [Amoeboaphelidium occidentale]|nr:hypothetical protein MP638_005959 [Amoeboaphelidium occidentale]